MSEADARLLLTPDEMAQVDARCPALGVASLLLMDTAGRAVAEAVARHFSPRRTAVLCGPGNNGGDGYVAARWLAAAGWDVWTESLVDPSALNGDAAEAARAWGRPIKLLSGPPAAELYIDALFGAGLTRPLEGLPAELARALPSARVVGVDVPSGVFGDGRPSAGPTFSAALTVTFCRKKPAHVLEPSRTSCGEIVLADIGAPAQAVAEVGARAWENHPLLWRSHLPRVSAASHKHERGRLTIATGGAAQSGAARLAARAGARCGAGYVTLACPPSALLVNAVHVDSILLTACASIEDLRAAGERAHAFVLGPAFGLTARAKDAVRALAGLGKPLVLDADALSIHADDPAALFALTHGQCVLTPHAGEFKRLFPDLLSAPVSKIEQARQGARRARAVVVFKGADTVIAAPDGRVAVNTNASFYLATAGSGDVLSGMIGSFLAQGVAPFEAACAGVWIHGAAGSAFGPGLIADDLPDLLPSVLAALFAER